MFTRPRGPANGPSGSLRATCCTARLMDPPRVCCWERYPPGRPRKRSWRSYAACWTNIKRGHDDHHCTPGRNAAGQGCRLEPISLAVGRRAGRAGPAGGAARHALAARALCMRLCSDARRAGGVRHHILCPRAAGEGARRGRSAHDPARGVGRQPSVAGHAGAVPHGGSAALAGALLDVGRVAPSSAQRCRLDGREALAPARRLQCARSVAPTARPTPRAAAALEASRTARDLSRRCAGGHRLCAPGDSGTRGSAGRDACQPGGSDSDARTGAHPPPRLPGEPAANGGGKLPFLSPGDLVRCLAGMPASQVEAILMHELAHIRRHDYLANLLQMVVESFLFYHPAIWWMFGVIRAEREKCCDDLVVAASGDAHHYAAALAALEQTRWAANEAVLAATGGSLMKRIHRLLYQPKASALAPVFSAGILMIAAVGAMAAWQAQSPAPPAEPQAKVDRYTRWLNEDVVYIIDGRERAAFLSLKTDPEREHFMQQFWERRNPTPGSPDNAFRNEHYRRIGYAVMHFGWQAVPGWKTDRGRIYIAFGPPDEIEFHPEGQPAGASLEATNAPTEEWLYHSIKGIGSNVIMEFVDTAKTGDFRMTMDPNADKGTFVRRP